MFIFFKKIIRSLDKIECKNQILEVDDSVFVKRKYNKDVNVKNGYKVSHKEVNKDKNVFYINKRNCCSHSNSGTFFKKYAYSDK